MNRRSIRLPQQGALIAQPVPLLELKEYVFLFLPAVAQAPSHRICVQEAATSNAAQTVNVLLLLDQELVCKHQNALARHTLDIVLGLLICSVA